MKVSAARRVRTAKMVASAALLVLFGCVVFTIPAERLAWQGPYVMGTLLLPRPTPGYVRAEVQKVNSDSSFNLLGFFSVAGILVLSARKVWKNLPGGRLDRLLARRRVPDEDRDPS